MNIESAGDPEYRMLKMCPFENEESLLKMKTVKDADC